MQFTDSHIHLQDYKAKNAPKIIAELKSLNFARVICVSDSMESWTRVAYLSQKYSDMIIPAFGLHPWHIKGRNQDWENSLKQKLLQFPKALIGECGIDRLKVFDETIQSEIFHKQILLANTLNRSLIIHSLKSEALTEAFLPKIRNKFMVHSFGGSINFLQRVLSYGGYISLSFSVLKRKNFQEIICNIPLEKLLLESDGPYQSDYVDISSLAETIANLKEISTEKVVSSVYTNFKEFTHGK